MIDRKFMDALPNLGRNVMSLSYLTPGVASASNGKEIQTGQSQNNFSANGGRSWTADIYHWMESRLPITSKTAGYW